MQIEGLQALKPQFLASKSTGEDGPRLQPGKSYVTNKSGLDFAANLIENPEDLDQSGDGQHWVVESVKVAVKEPVSDFIEARDYAVPLFFLNRVDERAQSL
jgi:hypothetical protein